MPDSMFINTRGPSQTGVYGPRRVVPHKGPVLRQTTSTGFFAAHPLFGSLIVCLAPSNTDQTSSRFIDGCGVPTWNLIAHNAVGGANNTSTAFWWGIVGHNPGNGCIAQSVGFNSGTGMAEFTGVDGTLLTAGGVAGGTAFNMRTTLPGGKFIIMAAGTGTLTPSPSAVLTTALSAAPNRVVYIGYSTTPMPANTTYSAQVTDSGGRSCAAAIIIK